MATYWHMHPRNFANECIILRAETPEQAARLAELGFNRLTRDRARRHIRWVNAENAAWGSNRAFGNESFATLTDATTVEYSAADYLAGIDKQAELDRLEEEYWASGQ